ncbi:diguanylate cyclase [Thermomonas sp. HDW16]|uniref:sensor domain-containing diguanylate cyclase n=1 Tax=Thermomonas sp. HDW16 TaxID=2714945 RepID=UPI00140D56C6|nr:diguanylate cyclase [Thermomonas sp. HDW16]QIL20884.1 GGDEF domain-containing protein [Thermomonas sp. HDW16]
MFGLALLLAAGNGAARAVEPLTLEPGQSSIPLSPSIAYRHDTMAADGATEAFARAKAGEFATLPNGNPTFGFQSGAYWFYLPVVNRHPEESRWLLVQEYALSDQLDVYVRYPDGRVDHQASGDHQPFSSRFIRYRHPNFRLDLPLGEPVEVLVRVQSESSMQVPLVLYTPRALAEIMRDAQFSTGLYYGIVLALLFYNLVLWIMLRDPGYFWYLLHTGAFGLVLFTLNGYGFEYFWPNWPWMADASVPLSICLALIGMQQFSRTFLELRERWPAGNRVSVALIGFFVLLGIASIWLPYSTSTPLASKAVLFGVIWIIVAAVVMLRRGYRPARLFLLAWSLFLLGTAAFTLLAFGLVPRNFWTQNGVQIGSALEMLLLSLALGARYAGLRNENIRIVQQANEQLERSVIDRTKQLRTAMAQLGEANVQLREYSQRDPLTGVYNRRHFREAFQQALDARKDNGKPLALLLLDLDHFKQINDNYGHLAGDDCLHFAARSMEDVVTPHGGLVARFGGEEFVAVLPGSDAQAALRVAEAIRLRIHQTPVASAGHNIRLSASIGVHTVPDGHQATPEDVIRIADEALYRAKDDGRNCVRHSMSAV